MSKEFSCLKFKGNHGESDLKLQQFTRQDLEPDNKPFLTCRARELTIPHTFRNRREILDQGYYLKDTILLCCYSCNAHISKSANSTRLREGHLEHCLHRHVKKLDKTPEDVFVNENPADNEACVFCRVKLKKVLLPCSHLICCIDCLLQELHSGPSGATGPSEPRNEGIKCPYCGTYCSQYSVIQWE
ncbi:unnamed protein product [Lymnaea stagnalis]|uniref:RING-type domain-containing protein n=1 Tax=Lymnaea stagnalis TaxID=6523 RepID=A0AAV2H2L1_LYMST